MRRRHFRGFSPSSVGILRDRTLYKMPVKLSFVIPLYNTADYISQCISSIVQNTADKSLYEIIVVDDGSTDSSARIVEGLCEKFTNISLICEQNHGVSAARMTGVSKAKGDYIWFIDSDDYLTPNATCHVLSWIEKYPNISAFVTPMLYSFDIDHSKDFVSPVVDRQISVTGKELLKGKNLFLVGPPHFIFRRSLFLDNSLYFPKNVRNEDEYFSRVLKYRAQSILILKQALYIYRQWSGSHMNSITMDNATDIITVYKHLDNFASNEVDVEDQSWFREDIVFFLLESITRFRSQIGTIQFYSFKKTYHEYFVTEWRKYQHYFSWKNRVLGNLLLVSPRFYFFILDTYDRLKLYVKQIKR